MIRIFKALGFSILLSSAAAAQTATLKMRFVFDGIPPPQNQIVVNPVLAPLAGPPTEERLLVDPKSKGIKNVLVYVVTGPGGSKIALPPAQNQKRRMTIANGRFDPHILIAQAGDTIELVDPVPSHHNPKLNLFKNDEQSFLVPPGNSRLFPVPKPEPTPVKVECNIHPWMRAYVVVLDHQFAAVSDSDGNLAISGLPVGTSLTFRVFHDAGRIVRVKMSGGDTDWSGSRFVVKLDTGEKNLGDIHVPSESLNP